MKTNLTPKALVFVFFFFATLFSSFIFSAPIPVFADEAVTSTKEAAINALEISPAERKYTLDPSAVKNDVLTVTNTGTKTLNYEVKVEPFWIKVDDVTGEYAGDYTTSNRYTQITSWITTDSDSGTLQPGEMKDITFTITVPADAPGGTQHAAIFVSGTETSKDAGTVNAITSPGLVIRADINGTTRETGTIKNITIPKFLLAPPITATAEVENTGNVDQDIKVIMKVENYFTGSEIYSNASSDPFQKTIMPEMSRKLEITAKTSPRLGLYKVTLTTDYLNETKVNTGVVIICPIWLIAVLLLMLGIIVFSIVMKLTARSRSRSHSRNSTGSSGEMNI